MGDGEGNSMMARIGNALVTDQIPRLLMRLDMVMARLQDDEKIEPETIADIRATTAIVLRTFGADIQITKKQHDAMQAKWDADRQRLEASKA